MDKLLPPAGTMMLPTEEHAEPSFHRIKINLVHLSPELLVDIVTMLPRSDLKSLRLMNRVLCGIASSKMFESITVRDDPRSLEQLKQIASSQTWASQVRHIDWLLCTVAGDSKNSWWPDPVFLLSRLMKPHLTVQCEYLQLLPSIKTVHFTGHVSELTTLLPEPASDLYVLVTRAKLQPSVVQAGNLSLEIGYGSSGYIRELSISGVAPQIEDASEAQGPFFAPTLRPWPEGGATLSPLVFRTIACQMENVVLASCNEGKDPLEDFLGLFKDRAVDTTIPVLEVTMINITKKSHEGMVSIDDAEVNCWIKDQDSHWLAKKQNAFTPISLW